MVTPAEDAQVHRQGPGRVSLSVSSGTEGEKSDSYQVLPEYSQPVPDRTIACTTARLTFAQFKFVPIIYIMSS